MRDVKRARILKRARCICVMFVRARCNVSHRASVRKNALLFSPARRSSSFSAAARRVKNALLFENATRVDVKVRTARDSRVGQRAERSVTVRPRVDRAPYRVFKRRGLRCVDAGFAMGDGRTRVSMRDARGAWTRIGARRVRGASARAARPRVGAATRHCRQTRCRAARQLTLSFSSTPRDCLFEENSRAKRRGFLRKKPAKRRFVCALVTRKYAASKNLVAPPAKI